MKFKQYLREMEGVEDYNPNVEDSLGGILKIIETMDKDELNSFGNWLYSAMYDDTDYDTDSDIEDNDEPFEKDEVIEMVNSLDADDLDYVYDMLENSDMADPDDTGTGHVEDYDIDESLNEKKFFKKKKVVLNREKKQNRLQRRLDKKKRKKDYRKHKAKIKRTQKKYRRKAKRQPNMVRHHR